jgi:hypothetical protein
MNRISVAVATLVIALPIGLFAACGSQAAPQQAKPAATEIAGGRFQASGVVEVPGTNVLLFVDDKRPSELFLMELDAAGTLASPAASVPLGADVIDPEGITTDGKFFYVVSSLSEPATKTSADLIRFAYDPVTKRTSGVSAVGGLRAFLQREVAELRGGDLNDSNIEGLAWDPANRRLLLGFRTPVIEGQALVVPIQLRDASGPFSLPNLIVSPQGVIRLPLAGAGIRGLEYDTRERRFLVVTDEPSGQAAGTFRLVDWRPGADPMRELARFPADLKPEGVTRTTLDGQEITVVIFDTGHYQIIR